MEYIIKSILEDIINNVIMSSKIIGAHINREKTLKKTIEKLHKYGGNALQIFTSNPSNCSPANLDKYIKEYDSIKDLECNFVIHASYTINIASLDPKQIKLNMNTITTDLIIADKYKAIGVILHVGKYVKNKPEDCMKQMKEFILEIKTVPLADYVDCSKKERYLMEETIISKEWNQKIAYFPDGYRKNKSDPVSPRALKHIQELEKIALIGKYKCYLLFIIQRIDVFCFQTSVIDPIYKDAVKKASDNGVNILTLQVNWNKEDGKAYYYPNDLSINL